MSEVKNECPNCGYDWSKGEKYCKYCGTPNPTFVDTKKLSDTFSFFQSSSTNSSTDENSENNSKPKEFSAGLFILLLIICWPAAIIYAIVTNNK